MPATKTAWVDFKEIKAKVSIVQILERYGCLESLAKSGSGDRLSGACPIHGGTNKTHFRVSISKNCWNCFGKCQSGGNIIDFVSKKEEVPFRDAALLIQQWFIGETDEDPVPTERPRFATSQIEEQPRQRAPVPTPSETVDEAEDQEPNLPLRFELSKLETAHPYLRERELTEETIATFGLGYCGKGLLRGYIAIPIHNTNGELVAYAGRWPGLPDEGKGKYKLPQGFKKSIELFNFHRAIASEDEVPIVVVEGFFDAMKLHQAGYEKVVALMGSSLSRKQEEMLCRLCETPDERIILLFDGDEAGQKGQADALARLSRRLYVMAIDIGGQGVQPEHLSRDQLETFLPFSERRAV